MCCIHISHISTYISTYTYIHRYIYIYIYVMILEKFESRNLSNYIS